MAPAYAGIAGEDLALNLTEISHGADGFAHRVQEIEPVLANVCLISIHHYAVWSIKERIDRRAQSGQRRHGGSEVLFFKRGLSCLSAV